MTIHFNPMSLKFLNLRDQMCLETSLEKNSQKYMLIVQEVELNCLLPCALLRVAGFSDSLPKHRVQRGIHLGFIMRRLGGHHLTQKERLIFILKKSQGPQRSP